jgi:Secretion system C-terminal sorting domain
LHFLIEMFTLCYPQVYLNSKTTLMKKSLLLFTCIVFALGNVFAQPAYDNCNTSQNLVRQSGTTCTSSFAATTVAATPSSQAAIGGSLNIDDDVWFDFTLGAGQTAASIDFSSIAITGTNNGMIVQLWSNDCLTSQPYSQLGIGQSFNFYTWNLTGLAAGASYKIRVYTDNTVSRATFNICFRAGPDNDDCANATTLTPLAGVSPCTFTPGVFDGSTLQATPSSQTSGDGTGKDDDVWFQFTTISTPRAYTVTLSNATYNTGSGSAVIELWQTCGDATFVSWFPFSTTASLGTLSVNTNYKIRVYTYGTTSRFNGFNICVSYVTAPPANNVFTSATTVTLSNAFTCTTITTGGTTLGATPDNVPTCTGAPSLSTANDVWYKFIPTNSNATIKLTNKTLVGGTSNLMWLQVFESSNTNPKLCADNNTADSIVFDGSTTAKTLTVGLTYYLRIYNHDPASACSFDVCNYVPKPPTFDECAFAVNLFTSTDENCDNKVRLTNVNATSSSTPAPPCVTNAYNDIWLRFTAPTPLPSTGLSLSIQNFQLVTGSNPNLRYAIYGGTCGTLAYLSCDALPTLTAGTTYFIRIFSASGSGTGNFDVCIAPNPTTLTNTTCASAVTLTASTTQSGTYTQGTTYGLPTLSTITDCFGTTGSPNKVLWYKFVATASNHMVDFRDMVQLSANANALGYRVTTGTCPTTTALSTPVCVFGVSNQNQGISGLTIGQTYFIEVMENTFNGGPVSYKLRVMGTQAPDNNLPASPTLLIQAPTCNAVAGTFKFSGLDVVPAVPASMPSTYYQDVWYRFQAAATTATITVAGRLATPRIAIYDVSSTTLLDAGTEGYSYTATGLTVGTFYTIRLLNTSTTSGVNPQADFTICVSGVPSTTLAVGPTPTNCLTNDNTVVSTNSQRWLHFTRSGNLIASVFDGAVMGNMVAKYFINTAAIRSNAGVEYLDRNMEITPTTQPTTPVAIRLYFSKAEFDAYVAANDGDGNDAYWLNDIKVAKFNTLSCTNVIGTTGEGMFGIAGYGTLGTDAYYVDVVVPSFSGFYLKNVGAGVPLPVACNNFGYKLLGNTVQLSWSTLSEVNSSHFEIQRSTDGVNYTAIATIAAMANSTATKNYQYTDNVKANQQYYYRLKQIDKDGKEQFICRGLKVNTSTQAEIFSKVYPNPVTTILVMDIVQAFAGKADVQITNAVGQVMQQQSFNLQSSDTQLKINTQQLPAGMYSIKVITANSVYVQQITKL